MPIAGQFGITRVANVTGLDRIGIPVVMVCRPNSRSVAVSQGKGLDLDAAKASGLMEAIETWHAERMEHCLKLASYSQLHERHKVIDVARLPRIEGGLYDDDVPLLWVEGEDLLNGSAVWLPYEMVHSNYTLPRPTGHGCFPASTNGLASGNHYLEAVSHAICEVIERDSTTLWHYLSTDRRAATRLDRDSIEDDHNRQILDMLDDAGLQTVIWDTTTDIQVPSFYCLLLDDETESGHMGAGAGCHPAREVALSRALTEAVQTRTTYIAGSRDDLSPEEFSRQGRREKYDYARRMMSGGANGRRMDEVPCCSGKTLEYDLDELTARLARAGVSEIAAVDLSRPETAVHVVRVVIPGLEAPHDEDDYVPGPRAHGVRTGQL